MFWDDNSGQVDVDKGNWHHYEVRVKINDPPNSYTGEIETWYDGLQKALKTDYRFRKTGETFKIDKIMIATIHSDASDQAPQDNFIYYDNFIISTHQISAGPATLSNPLPSGEQECSEDPLPLSVQMNSNEPGDAQWCEDGVGDCDADSTFDDPEMTAYEVTGNMLHTHSITEACGQTLKYRSVHKDTLGNVGSQLEHDFSISGGSPPSNPGFVSVTVGAGPTSVDVNPGGTKNVDVVVP